MGAMTDLLKYEITDSELKARYMTPVLAERRELADRYRIQYMYKNTGGICILYTSTNRSMVSLVYVIEPCPISLYA